MMASVIDLAAVKARRSRRRSVETTYAPLLRLTERLLESWVGRAEELRRRADENRRRDEKEIAMLRELVAGLRELVGQKPPSGPAGRRDARRARALPQEPGYVEGDRPAS